MVDQPIQLPKPINFNELFFFEKLATCHYLQPPQGFEYLGSCGQIEWSRTHCATSAKGPATSFVVSYVTQPISEIEERLQFNMP